MGKTIISNGENVDRLSNELYPEVSSLQTISLRWAFPYLEPLFPVSSIRTEDGEEKKEEEEEEDHDLEHPMHHRIWTIQYNPVI